MQGRQIKKKEKEGKQIKEKEGKQIKEREGNKARARLGFRNKSDFSRFLEFS
jgi:hypothetical protein